MKSNLKSILSILDASDKRHLLALLSLMIFMAFLDIIGVASIVPFLAVLGNQNLIQSNGYLAQIYELIGFRDSHSFMIFLGVAALIFLLLTAAIRTVIQYLLARFSAMQIHSISYRLLQSYLQQPYSFFLKNNTSNMAKTIFTEVGEVVKQTFTPMLDLITYSMLVIVMMGVLLTINPKLAVILLLGIGGFYGVMHFILVRFLKRIGRQRRKANRARFQIASEIFGGIKDLKVLGREHPYISAFSEPSLLYAKYQAVAQIISQTPKFFIEVFIFGIILVIALSSLQENADNLGQILPVLGLYSMAAIRLKPAVDRIYESLSKMSFGTASLENVLHDLNRNPLSNYMIAANDGQRLKLNRQVNLEEICFTYPESGTSVLKNLSLELKAKTSIGIVGSTGSGKSTLIDIIIGLHQPDSGQVLIDGVPLTCQNIRAWQNNIGYVPQHIFLADGTISSNIAFGIPSGSVDFDAIVAAAKLAMIHDFILSLPNGYQTKVGERGVRLSGGQRQRIGIARALYHNPDLLIFDEATSALDSETEKELMRAIDSISGQKTIIMVAHRLSTLEKCVQIVKLGA